MSSKCLRGLFEEHSRGLLGTSLALGPLLYAAASPAKPAALLPFRTSLFILPLGLPRHLPF